MSYIRKLFTLPTSIADRLAEERNQSATVAKALDMYFNHQNVIKRVAASVERIEERLAESPHPNKHPAAQPYRRQQEQCCVSNRPNAELRTTPCRHWQQTDEGFKNMLDGDEVLL
jgi:hypothetical protein